MVKKITSKIATVCAIIAIFGCITFSNVYADEATVTYSAEYTENTVTLTLYITEINAFDIAASYDPTKVAVKEMAYTTEFKKLQSQGYTTLSVHNEDAVDEVGNTYAVFVGAGFTSDNDPIPFEGKPMATITFEGNVSDSEIRVFTNSADYEDISQAKPVGVISEEESTKAVVTAQPSDNKGAENNSDTNTATDNGNVPDDSEEAESADNSETEKSGDDTAASEEPTEAPEESKNPASTEKPKSTSAGEKDNKSGNAVVYISVAFVVIAVAAVVVFIIIKKKKSAAK